MQQPLNSDPNPEWEVATEVGPPDDCGSSPRGTRGGPGGAWRGRLPTDHVAQHRPGSTPEAWDLGMSTNNSTSHPSPLQEPFSSSSSVNPMQQPTNPGTSTGTNPSHPSPLQEPFSSSSSVNPMQQPTYTSSYTSTGNSIAQPPYASTSTTNTSPVHQQLPSTSTSTQGPVQEPVYTNTTDTSPVHQQLLCTSTKSQSPLLEPLFTNTTVNSHVQGQPTHISTQSPLREPLYTNTAGNRHVHQQCPSPSTDTPSPVQGPLYTNTTDNSHVQGQPTHISNSASKFVEEPLISHVPMPPCESEIHNTGPDQCSGVQAKPKSAFKLMREPLVNHTRSSGRSDSPYKLTQHLPNSTDPIWERDQEASPYQETVASIRPPSLPVRGLEGGPVQVEGTREKDALHGGQRNEAPLNGRPKWYTPLRMLLLFCYIMTLTWYDQGSFASNGVKGDWPSEEDPDGEPGIVIDLSLTPFEDGVLAAMYTVGLIIASVIFASLAGRVNELRLIGVGLLLWTIGSLATGGAQGYRGLIFARMLVGAGEASVMTLTFPFIDDCAPPESKTLWFGFLALCQPVGIALGFIVGGSIAEAENWRAPFFMQAALAIPVTAFCAFAPALSLRKGHEEPALGLAQSRQQHSDSDIVAEAAAAVPVDEAATAQLRHGLEDSSSVKAAVLAPASNKERWSKSKLSAPTWFWKQWRHVAILMQHRAWWFNNMGSVPVEFALQAMVYYGPRAGRRLFNKDSNEVDLTFGAIAVGTGVVGSLGGGFLLDKTGSSVKNGFGLMTVWVILGLFLLTIAFAASGLSYGGFITLICFGLLAIMALTPVTNALSMWTIPEEQRPMSQAILTVSQRALGDLPSTPIIGAVQTAVNNWRSSMLVATYVMALAVILYFLGWLFSKHHLVPEDFSPKAQGGGARVPETSRNGTLSQVQLPVSFDLHNVDDVESSQNATRLSDRSLVFG